MFSLKKLFQVWLALGIAFSVVAMPVHAENLDKSVKDTYEQSNSSSNSISKNKVNTTKEDTSSNVGISFWEFTKMIFTLIFVIALLYLVLRWIGKKTKVYQKANFIENLGGTSLGTNRSIQLVKIGDRVLVVGVGENIQLLSEIDDEEERNQLLEKYNQKMDQMIQPSDFLSQLKNKWGQSETSLKSFSSEFKTQLELMKKNRKKLKNQLDEKGRDNE